jgi:hypothetical protein
MHHLALMLLVNVFVVVGGVVAAQEADEPKTWVTPEEASRDDVNPEATVRFKVDDVGIVRGGAQPVGTNPPILLAYKSADERYGGFSVLLTGEIVDVLKRFGINHPDTYLKHRMVEVTGKIQRGDSTDSKPRYSTILTSLKQFRVAD